MVPFLSALLEVQVAISDGPRPPRGQSARTLRTVRLVLSRLLSPFLFELCFRVGLVWDLFLGLVGLL
jgi:hypothetical protein